jgi:hypothetical protein
MQAVQAHAREHPLAGQTDDKLDAETWILNATDGARLGALTRDTHD